MCKQDLYLNFAKCQLFKNNITLLVLRLDVIGTDHNHMFYGKLCPLLPDSKVRKL